MRSVVHALVGALFGAVAASGAASAVIIDFDDEDAGDIIDDEYAEYFTVTTNSNGANNAAVVFDTDNPTGNDSDLGAAFSDAVAMGGPLSPGNVLIISEDARGITCGMDTCSTPDDEGQGGVIAFDFVKEVIFQGFDVFDVSDGNATFSVDFLDLSGAVIATIVAPSGIGDNEYASYAGLAIEGVFGAVFRFGGSGAIDNIAFDVVPVPGALPLLITGLAGLGWARRRKARA